MSRIKIYSESFLDGLIYGIVFFVLSDYVISEHFYKSMLQDVLVLVTLIVLSSISGCILVIKKLSFIGCAINFLTILFFLIVVVFVNNFYLHLHIFSTRDLGIGDGITIILYEGIYLFASMTIRLLILLIVYIKRRLQRQKKTGKNIETQGGNTEDGSVC